MLSERFERSPAGRLAIHALVVLLLLAEIGTNLPASAVERAVGKPANQLVRALASEQTWGVFAPDPRRISVTLRGRVTFVDGSTAIWNVPDGPSMGANLRYYRWRKWMERVRSDEYHALWEPTARWIGSMYRDRRSPVARVELIRRFHDNVVRGPQPPWDEYTFFTLEMTEGQP